MQEQSVAVNRMIGGAVYAVCAASTASAEYYLARACGFGGMAWCLPAALDAYVLVALRVRRDTAFAVSALLILVGVSHLVSTGLLEVTATVVIGVSSVAPIILWRVHGLLWSKPKTSAVQPALQAAPAALEDHQRQATALPEPITTEPLQVEGPPPAWVLEALQSPALDVETLVEKLVADGDAMPGRSKVMEIYGVSEHTAKRALQEAKNRLQENLQPVSLAKGN